MIEYATWMKAASASWLLLRGTVVRHIKNPEDLRDSRLGPRTESLVARAVQWAERIMRHIDIDGLYSGRE